MSNSNKLFVIYRHLTMPDKGKCFFSTNNPKVPEERKGLSMAGERWYEVVGYADTVEEAQDICADNYGGLPTMAEFDTWAREQSEARIAAELEAEPKKRKRLSDWDGDGQPWDGHMN
jgi:hypothetical protein